MITACTILLSIISILSALLLIAIVMMQQNKAGGGLGAVSGGMTESMFGASADNVLVKITTWCAVVFLASTLVLAAVSGRASAGKKSIMESTNIPSATETAAPAAETAAPATETAAPATETAAPATETAAPATETAAPATETAAN